MCNKALVEKKEKKVLQASIVSTGSVWYNTGVVFKIVFFYGRDV